MGSGEESSVDVSNFSFEHNSLIKMDDQTFQLLNTQNDIKLDFYYQGGKVETMVYDEEQYKYKGFMAPVVKIDTTKSILSPMPGAVVSVAVAPGDTVVDGQELGVIESVSVKAGDSVAVDDLLIEFE